MDFGVVGLDNLLCSNAATALSINGCSFLSESDVDVNKRRSYGSGFLKQESTVDEDDLRVFKLARTTSFSENPFAGGNNGDDLSEHQHHQILSFSSPREHMLSFSLPDSQSVAFPFYYQQRSSAVSRSSGDGCGGVNAANINAVMSATRGPFTAPQWMELQHQALIYKYITANVPIPSYLLNPIRKALVSCLSLLRPNALGWGAFHLGLSNADPEPGRCRRTDGKKWRCSRDVVPDQKYCERHMNRGRHRSRKPVEGQEPGHAISGTTAPKPVVAPEDCGFASKNLGLLHHQQPNKKQNTYTECLPFSWPDVDLHPDGTHLSISIPTDSSTDEKLNTRKRIGSITSEQDNWVPVSWGRSVGGPLGEALLATSNSASECKALNLIENWDHTPRAESGKSVDGASFSNGVIGQGLMLPSLPAL